MMPKHTLALVLAFALVPAHAFAGDPKAEAQAHVHASEKLFQDGKYNDALNELTTAYALDPQPGLLYAIAQVHVKLGECADAITWYQRFLDTKPEERAAKAAHEAIEMCSTALPKQPEPPPQPQPPPPPQPQPPPPQQPPPVQPKPVAQPSPPAWYGSVLADALVIGGGVAGVTGIELYHRALNDFDRANTATSYASNHQLVEDGHSQRQWAVIASVGGVVLVGGGVAYYLLHVHSKEPDVTVSPTSSGAVVMWSGRF